MLGKALQMAAAGSAAGGEGLGVEDVFSTWLYTGNGSTQTITNGIKLGPSTTLGKTHKNSFTQNQDSQNFTFTAQPGDVLVIHVTVGTISAADVGTVIITVNGTSVSTDSVYDSSLNYFYRIAVVPVSGNVTYSVSRGAAFYLEASAFTISPLTPGSTPSVSVGAGYALTALGSYTVNSFASNGYGIAINTSREVLTSSVGQYGKDVDSFNLQNLWATSVHVISGSGSAVPSFQLTNLGTAYNNPVIVLNVQDAGIDPIDDPGAGGLVWIKNRDYTYENMLFDTQRGAGNYISTNQSFQEFNDASLTAFTSSGFSVGSSTQVNEGTAGYQGFASWTFRKAPKFFDVVTYTGNGVAGRTIAHNLGSVPGCIIVKRTDGTENWYVYHRSPGATKFARLNTTEAFSVWASPWDFTEPTSTEFTVGNNVVTNGSGATYVAYLFAHDAGGFGDDGTESVIKCGSFTTDGSGKFTVDLGWEPQWLIAKSTANTQGWFMLDTMRGMVGAADELFANAANAEGGNTATPVPTATGFTNATLSGTSVFANDTYIYIAIRRGPMKTPTDATEVFNAFTWASAPTTSAMLASTTFPVDAVMWNTKTGASFNTAVRSRLTGGIPYLVSSSTAAEVAGGDVGLDTNTGTKANFGISNVVQWLFGRAPGFFDVVAYTGDNSGSQTVAHNLGVAPELMILKRRNGAADWFVYAASGIDTSKTYPWPRLNGNEDGWFGNSAINSSPPTSSAFTAGSGFSTSNTFIAYLFATCPGVSKVGSYTGTGTTLQVDCGFASGARFVLIKRTDSTGDWYVWDTARGIVSGNDPYLLLNSTAAEVTSTDYIDPYSAGFEISSTAPAAINASGGSYIFLAIA